MVKIYADCADLDSIEWAHEYKAVHGITTNPSLMAKAGIKRYRDFAQTVVGLTDKPVSFEVLADDLETMDKQARTIADWSPNCYVKIPIVNTQGVSTAKLIELLSRDRIKVNVTAILTINQVRLAARSIAQWTPAIISIFAGRIADTGVDPANHFHAGMSAKHGNTELLWASTRELYNYRQAMLYGSDIITMTPDLIRKMGLFGKDLAQYSIETVTMFYNDSKEIEF